MKLFDNICASIIIILIIFACLIIIFSNHIAITYCGIAIIILSIFLSIDCYYRTTSKETYEDLLQKFSDLINLLITKL